MSKTATDPVPLVPTFQLGGVGSQFQSKSKDVFGVLQTLEDKHEALESARRKCGGGNDAESLWKVDPVIEPDLKDRKSRMQLKQKSNTRDSSRKGDNFKKPYSRLPRNNRHTLPDYKKHLENYTCYSLSDVSTSDMSEASNSKAAFEFLEERRKFREALERGSDYEEEEKVDFGGTACSKGAITFKKRNKSDGHTEKMGEESRKTTLLDLHDGDEEQEEKDRDSQEDKTDKTNFKSRKSRKKNLRVREETDEEDDD